jgi:hypothetical protein
MQHATIYILWFLAAILNAVMDRTENLVAFNRSIFNHLDPKFWCKEISWQYAKKIFSWKADCWHIAKSSMVICLAASLLLDGIKLWEFPIFGIVWNVTFNTFYNHILKR